MKTETVQKQTKTAAIVPDISLMKKMASISGTIPSRIMELVDNSIDAKLPGVPVEIDVNVMKKGQQYAIEIIDNGHGMSEIVARSFFQLGKSQKTGKRKIGRFGLGSKVAILGIGDTCRVLTSPHNEPYSVEIDFDIRKFKDWSIDYRVKEAPREEHGTKIRIENVTVRIGDMDRFLNRLHEHFSKTYKHFLDSKKAIIRINGKKVEPLEIEILPGFFQKFSFEVQGKKVFGWAGAMKEAGTNWKFGFDLINNGRIIKSNDLLSRQAHTSLARLVGEIHLDDFKTDIHKTDFLRDDPVFQEMQDTLINEVLADLISKISKLTNREVFSKYQTDMNVMSKALNRVVRSYDFLRNIDLDEGVLQLLKKKARQERMKTAVTKDDEMTIEQLDELLEMVEQHQKNKKEDEEHKEKKERPRKTNPNVGLVIEEPIAVSLGEDQPAKRWISFEREDGVHLQIEINLDHPAYVNEDEVAVLVRNEVLESVAEFILKEEKKQLGLMEDEVERLHRIKDMLVRHSIQDIS